MYKYYELDKNATVELTEETFQKIKRKALKIIAIAQKEHSLDVLCEIDNDLNDLLNKLGR